MAQRDLAALEEALAASSEAALDAEVDRTATEAAEAKKEVEGARMNEEEKAKELGYYERR